MIDAVILYGVPLLAAWAFYTWRTMRASRHGHRLLAEARRDGLMEPASLHPIIDPNLCLGCGSCVTACPEKNVLGIVAGKATLVSPSNCIGHGACKDSCPTDAIELVLGTERRGIEIPAVGPNFETNVPGIFVAGELGGMGLIRNGIEQGRQAVDAIATLDGIGSAGLCGEEDMLDVVIVGAGPAGFSASLAAMERGLRFETLEQESLGGTVAHYPRGKIVMTAPVDIPMHGKVKLRETSKEALLELWSSIAEATGLVVRYEERVEAIEPTGPDAFEVRSSHGRYRARAVLLAIGRRGTPRKLGVRGEASSKVTYRLVDPEQYRGAHVLVVGGGDSALEAACALADEPGTQVTLSYRGEAFGRAKGRNRERVAEAARGGTLRVLLGSKVRGIEERSVELSLADGSREQIENDSVIVCAGGVLPTDFLRKVGISIETRHGER